MFLLSRRRTGPNCPGHRLQDLFSLHGPEDQDMAHESQYHHFLWYPGYDWEKCREDYDHQGRVVFVSPWILHPVELLGRAGYVLRLYPLFAHSAVGTGREGLCLPFSTGRSIFLLIALGSGSYQGPITGGRGGHGGRGGSKISLNGGYGGTVDGSS